MSGPKNGDKQDAETAPSDVPVPQDTAHTEGGAPTDEAHQDAGDGTLTGVVPAGLSVDELLKVSKGGRTDDGGTG